MDIAANRAAVDDTYIYTLAFVHRCTQLACVW